MKFLAPISTGESNPVYRFLDSKFDAHDGSQSGYLTALSGAITTYSPQTHYNLRAFATSALTTPRTMLDMSFWNVGKFQGITMGSLTSQSITAWSESWAVLSGTGGNIYGTVTLSNPTQFRYSDMLSFTNTGTNPSGTLISTYNDDILSDFNTPGVTYFVEMLLRGFPDQTAPVHLNLTNSFIDFSSDTTGLFDPAQTDSVAFSSSLTNISNTNNGDVLFRINRSSLTNSSLATLKYIRMRLVGTGTGALNFNAQAMRVVPSGVYTYPSIAINTKKKALHAALTISGTYIFRNPDSGLLFFNPSRPKNTVQYTRFNTGHFPVAASGTNALDLYYRYVQNSNASFSFDKIVLSGTTSGQAISINETISGTNTRLALSPNLNLVQNTDYFLRTEVDEGRIRAAIVYTKNKTGAQTPYGSLFLASSGVWDSGYVTLNDIPRRGYVAYQFKPYNYDFLIHYIRLRRAEFAKLQTTPYTSFTPVVGAVLNANFSLPLNITSGIPFQLQGDATTTDDLSIASDPDAVITRTGNTWYGAFTTSGTIDIGDTREITISGRVFPYTGFAGNLRVALVNQWTQVAFLVPIPTPLNNQWNNFFVPIRTTNIPPDKYTLWIFDSSFSANTFELTDVQINHNVITWHGSSDGVTFQPFYEAINEAWNGLQFLAPGRNLTIKALSLSDQGAWIDSFNAIPIYYGYQSLLI